MLSSPQRQVQQSAAFKPVLSQQGATSASSQPSNQPERYKTSSQPANLSASSWQDVPSASNWPVNMPAYSGQDDGWTESRLANSRNRVQPGSMLAGHWSQGVVPLPANFKQCGTPRCTEMSAVATHIDEQCCIFVHELQSGLYYFSSCLYYSVYYHVFIALCATLWICHLLSFSWHLIISRDWLCDMKTPGPSNPTSQVPV